MPLKDSQITIRDLSFSVEGKALLQNTSLSLSGDGITVLLGEWSGENNFFKTISWPVDTL